MSLVSIQAPASAPKVTASVVKKLLHVGCGPKNPANLPKQFQEPGWQEVRVDLNPAVKPDILASIISMPQVPDNSHDAVFSSHNLEHLFSHEVPLALREFLRVLKPGGLLWVTMPDLQAAAEYLAKGQFDQPIYVSPAGPITALDVCFGHQASVARGNIFMAHKTGFSAETLTKYLTTCGFEKLNVKRHDLALTALATKPK
jgi:predicted SAM-dependent methyltransferase